MSKVLIISTIPPVPIDSGKKVVLNGILDYLNNTFGNQNVDYVVLDEVNNIDDIDDHSLISIKQNSAFMKIKNVLFYSLITRRKSIQESVFYSKEIKQTLDKIINDRNYALIVLDTIRIGQFFEKEAERDSRYILYLDDLFSIRYKKMLEAANTYNINSINALGNFEKYIPKIFKRLISGNAIEKALLNYERKLLITREKKVSSSYSNNYLINSNEVNLLNSYLGNNSVNEIRPYMPMEIKKFEYIHKTGANFVFLGGLNIPHNDQSITYFIEKNIQKLIAKIPNFKLIIIGKKPSSKLIALVERYKGNIDLKGYVEDLDEIFSQAQAMIVPLLFGSGVKLKTLESMSRGLPVIGTDFAFEGIASLNKDNCVKENKIENYPDQMLKLMEPELNQKLSVNAFQFFLDNYTKQPIYKHYGQIFRTNNEKAKHKEIVRGNI